ncbi:hypothetical protein J6590_024687 [Homalodisca vitripennis]|nr:hypothetical protein J6590_024687 [Homalodisca vitripennis]
MTILQATIPNSALYRWKPNSSPGDLVPQPCILLHPGGRNCRTQGPGLTWYLNRAFYSIKTFLG